MKWGIIARRAVFGAGTNAPEDGGLSGGVHRVSVAYDL